MDTIGFAIPLLPGKTEAERAAMKSCWRGERTPAYEDARRRAGITREATWIQSTPGGDFSIAYIEADDLATALKMLGTSEEPFDRWFREHVREMHGIALEDGFPPPEQVLDYRAEPSTVPQR
jgi:hypothetical protein